MVRKNAPSLTPPLTSLNLVRFVGTVVWYGWYASSCGWYARYGTMVRLLSGCYAWHAVHVTTRTVGQGLRAAVSVTPPEPGIVLSLGLVVRWVL